MDTILYMVIRMESISDIVRLLEKGDYTRAYRILEESPRLVKQFMETIGNADKILEKILVAHILRDKEIVTRDNPIIDIAFNGKLSENIVLANTVAFTEKLKEMLENNELDKAVEYIRKNMKYIESPQAVEEPIIELLLQHKLTPEQVEQLYKALGLQVPEKLEHIIRITEELRKLEENTDKLVQYIEEKVGEKLKQLAELPVEQLVKEHPEVLEALGLTPEQVEQVKALVESGVHSLLKKLYNTLDNLGKDNIIEAVNLLLEVKDKLDMIKDKIGRLYDKYIGILSEIAEKLTPEAIYLLVAHGDMDEAEKLAKKVDKEFGISICETVLEAFKQLSSITPEEAIRLVEA